MYTARQLSSGVALGLALLCAGAPLAFGQPRAAASASAAPSASAAAPVAQVPAEIMVLHATNTGGGIDPRIGDLPQLKRPPFSAYNTYKLISRNAITLTTSRPDTSTLPNGRVLRTALKEILEGDKYRVAASISRPRSDSSKEDTFLPLLEVTAKSGETFFVAGQSYRGGILVVGIRVGAPVQAPSK